MGGRGSSGAGGAKPPKMPELSGSAKQISWANDIRKNLIQATESVDKEIRIRLEKSKQRLAEMKAEGSSDEKISKRQARTNERAEQLKRWESLKKEISHILQTETSAQVYIDDLRISETGLYERLKSGKPLRKKW